ncbi:PhnA-like protein [Shinella curvata]|uniref:PhnA-like protein n=1 Tax=Shinella curvata TaxID=1817964 RepID=A0ABT8XKE3_9HYPH|nr:PhnA-like protein [Shinella curvata]MCJ8056862.1 PhnA-like protein [Shinella curvata]MDO6124197.1 PhnA-like protein [Shinella curvata]
MTDSDQVVRSSDRLSSPNLHGNVLLNRISWGAVLAGVAVALSVQVLLNLLGVGIGASVIDPATSDNPSAGAFSTVGVIWFVVAGVVASFIGGYIASRLSGRPVKSTGGYHGLTSWAVTTLLALYLLTTSIGALVGGAFSGLGSMLVGLGRTAATTVTAAAPVVANVDNPFSDIEQQIRSVTNGNDPQALRDAAVAAVQAAVSGDQARADDARHRAADALARAQDIPLDQAKSQVAQYEVQYKQAVETAKQKAVDTAEAATKIVAAGAILAFAALLLGAVASWFGGAMGTKLSYNAASTRGQD